MLENIEYLPLKKEFHIGDVKNLAVLTNQKDVMGVAYPKVQNATVSNADMLSQSFNSNPVTEASKAESVNEPVQISSIPNVQNNFNMESNPVDLNLNPVMPEPVNSVPTMGGNDLNIPSMENVVNNSSIEVNAIPNVPVIEPINVNSVNTPIQSNPIDQTNGFKVSNEPNIFDSPAQEPFAISQEDINKPLENNSNIIENNVNIPNIFNQTSPETNNNVVREETNIIENEGNFDSSINDDIILAQIAIEESNVKHYEALAENSKKKIELLKRQVKTTKKQDENNLENTASNLFNSNGILDEEKVLGKTPMPNMMVA